MGKTMSDLYTAGGISLDEAASALQKSIRRGMELEALFFAQELESRFANFLWKRLLVIAHEDVGIANPTAVPFVRACYNDYRLFIDEFNEHNGLALVNAVLYLCRSPKSRIADHLYSIIYMSPITFDVPDFAFDKHTRRGKAMGRGMDHFYEVGAVVVPDVGMNEYLERAWEIDKAKQERPWLTNLKERLRKKKDSGSKGKQPSANQTSMFD